MDSEGRDEFHRELTDMWRELVRNTFRLFAFAVSVGLKYLVAQGLIELIKHTTANLTASGLIFFGFDVHQIVTICELFVFLTFLIVAAVTDVWELVRHPVRQLRSGAKATTNGRPEA